MDDGHQVLSDELYRGKLLVYTEEEWRDGYQAFMRARLTFDAFTIGALGAVMVFVALWTLPLVSVVMLACLLLVSLAEVIAYRTTQRTLEDGGTQPGVYEKGVEMPRYPIYAIQLFIPWTEMEDAWVKRSRMTDDVLFIAVRNSRWRWRFPGRLLGEQGMQTVVSRARAPHAIEIPEPVQDAPKLVIYSAEGAKSESVPKET